MSCLESLIKFFVQHTVMVHAQQCRISWVHKERLFNCESSVNAGKFSGGILGSLFTLMRHCVPKVANVIDDEMKIVNSKDFIVCKNMGGSFVLARYAILGRVPKRTLI